MKTGLNQNRQSALSPENALKAGHEEFDFNLWSQAVREQMLKCLSKRTQHH